ncbi:MAG: rRNA (cytidine1402-2-O)-methyltransferase [Chloroflexota bacterium]|nr:rRNA (cytidine1402-2-O)-methyltransferase [Chloroflexota bacterium]
MSGRLFVVATPIGNLSDVTLRSLEVLRDVPLIAAEDTRLTRRLLERHGIATRTTSFHAQSGPGRLAELLAHLRSGADLALVTDAGTPSVSDPGDDLVAGWAAEGGVVVPIPGASAVLAVVAASAVAGPRWSFEGFLPRSGRERKERIARIAADERGTVIYEAPGRVAATLVDLAAACGAERPAAIGRELTKLHEEIVRGSLGDLAGRARSGELTLRGEFALVVGAWTAARIDVESAGGGGVSAGADAEAAALAEVERRVAAGSSRGDAARTVAAETGIPRRKLYRVGGAGS